MLSSLTRPAGLFTVATLPTLLSTLVVCSVVFSAGRADAQAIRAAALSPQFKNGTGTPELRDKFHDIVVQGLAALAGPSGPNGELGDVLTAAETRDHLGDLLASCGNDASCLGRASAALHVNRLVSTEITVAGKSYTITMRLYDGAAHELTHANELCEICTVHEAEEAVQKTAARLAAASRTFPVEEVGKHAESRSRPAVDAPPPAQPPVSPMQDNPNPIVQPPPRSGRYVPWRPLGFGAIGLAVVGLAVGIPLLVIDGRPTCNAPDPTHSCPHVYNTTGGGAAMLTIGVLGLVAAIPLFYFDWKDRHRGGLARLELRGAPTQGGGAFMLEGRF